MPFFYFSESPEQIESLRESRFWDLKTDGGLCRQSVDVGPNGKPGHLIYYAPFGTQLKTAGYSKDGQEWIDCGEWWLGWEKGKKPGPEDLVRSTVISGYLTKLADGKDWTCPVIRQHAADREIPNVPYTLSRIGEWAMSVKSDYMDAWVLSGVVWDRFHTTRISPFELFEMATVFLSVNYRIGDYESSVLQIMDADSMTAIVQSALDVIEMENLIEELKKKQA